MKCFSCQAECPSAARFCPNCGRDFRPKKPERREAPSHDMARMREESLRQLQLLRAKKSERSVWVCGVALAVAVMLTGLIWFGIPQPGVLLFAGVVPLFLGGAVAMYLKAMRSSDYYAIAHSRDSAGHHRCIWCGNKGIWRQGEYATNNTHHRCSKCQVHFFTD